MCPDIRDECFSFDGFDFFKETVMISFNLYFNFSSGIVIDGIEK